MPDDRYLQRRGYSWYVVVRVPPALRKIAGQHLRKALRTRDKRVAQQRKWRIVAQLKAQIEHLRATGERPTPSSASAVHPHGDPRGVADQIRRLRAEGDHEEADNIELAAQYIADEIDATQGRAARDRWLAAAWTEGKTLDEHFGEWLTGADLKDSTKANYKLALQDLRASVGLREGDSLLVEDIDDKSVAQFVFKFMPSTHLGNRGIAGRLSALSSFWVYLQQHLGVPPGRNPWIGHRLPKRGKKRDVRAFTDAELVKLLTGTPRANKVKRYPRVRDLMLLGMYTGARLNESCSLRVADVEMAEDGASATLAIREGKTDAAARTISVTHWAVLAMLQRRLKDKKPTAQLFEELRPGGADKKLSDSVSKAFTRYRRACGVPDGPDYHSLRRCFMTLHEHKATDYVAVARFVGHEVPTMMHAVYSAGASREALLKVADATRYGPEVEKAVAALA